MTIYYYIDTLTTREETIMPEKCPLLEMSGIVKRFPGVLALDDARLEVREGEILGLVGENGAGKSTLMKILCGAIPRDGGVIRVTGREVAIRSPQDAHALGIRMVHQEFNLVPKLSVAENILLGRLGTGRLVNWSRVRAEAEAVLNRLNMAMDVTAPVGTLSIAQQQMVEIAKALSARAILLILDEPSATLTDHELETLFRVLRGLREEGMGIIYISHRLEELFEIAQRVTIMRDGRTVATRDMADITRDEIIRLMVGRELAEEFPRLPRAPGEIKLEARDISRRGVFNGVSMTLRAGEIVGLTGLVGSGRTEVARALFGADPLDEGEIIVKGRRAYFRSPRLAIDAGLGLLTEDRKRQGLVLGMSIRENITLARLEALGPLGLITPGREKAIAADMVRKLSIKTPSPEQYARNLSGGNQQKVVLAKWLFTGCDVLIFDEPTRGIDVGAKAEIYRIINELAAGGAAVLVISSELPEVIGLCDRVLVMHEGRLQGALHPPDISQEAIMRLATGGGARAVVH